MSKPSCAAWSAALSGAGVPAGPDVPDGVDRRADLRARGGGLAVVGSKYYVSYFPPGYDQRPDRRVVVVLHGTGGSPEAEWNDFANAEAETDTLDQHRFGFLGLKYLDDASGFYDDDDTIYANLTSMLAEVRDGCDLGDPKLFVFGFSRGSAKTFAMAYLDSRGQHLFSGFASASGGAWQQPKDCAWTRNGTCGWQAQDPLFPSECTLAVPYNPMCMCPSFLAAPADEPVPSAKPLFASSILNAAAGAALPYSGSRFWLYCGERDYAANYRLCGDMEMSKVFVETFGGTVDELYVAGAPDTCFPWTGTGCIKTPDTKCGHGGHKQPTPWAHLWARLEAW